MWLRTIFLLTIFGLLTGNFTPVYGINEKVKLDSTGTLTFENQYNNSTYSWFFYPQTDELTLGLQHPNGIYSPFSLSHSNGQFQLTLDLIAQGKISIGGSFDPQAGLHIKGADYPDSFAFFDTISTDQDSGIRFYEAGTVRGHFYHDGSENAIRFENNPNENQLVLADDGRVGIGFLSPTRTLSVNGDAGGNTVWSNDSDIRLKKNIAPITDSLAKIVNLRGIQFEWKNPQTHAPGKQLGFVAQEVQPVLPEVVEQRGDYLSMKTSSINAIVVEAIKEQQNQIEALKAENAELKRAIQQLLDRFK